MQLVSEIGRMENCFGSRWSLLVKSTATTETQVFLWLQLLHGYAEEVLSERSNDEIHEEADMKSMATKARRLKKIDGGRFDFSRATITPLILNIINIRVRDTC
jgi:hypothetical protein